MSKGPHHRIRELMEALQGKAKEYLNLSTSDAATKGMAREIRALAEEIEKEAGRL